MTRSRNISGTDRIAGKPRSRFGMGVPAGLGGKISPQTNRLNRIRGNPDGEAGVSHRAGGFCTELGTSTAFSMRKGKEHIVCGGMESEHRGMQHGVVACDDVEDEGRARSDSKSICVSGVGTVTSVIGEGDGLRAVTGDYGVRAGGAIGTIFIRSRAGGDVGGRHTRPTLFSGPAPFFWRSGDVAGRSDAVEASEYRRRLAAICA